MKFLSNIIVLLLILSIIWILVILKFSHEIFFQDISEIDFTSQMNIVYILLGILLIVSIIILFIKKGGKYLN